MKKSLVLCLIIGIFFITHCSKLLGTPLNKDISDFTITSLPVSKGKVEINFSRSDHLNIKTTAASGRYFRGYYIYRSENSPYQNLELIGIDSYSNLTANIHTKYTDEFYSSVLQSEKDAEGLNFAKFIDRCSPNHFYFYRVAVVYKKWNGSSWADIEDEAQSSWTAEFCPDDIISSF